MKLGELFSNNYKYLETVAIRITRSKNRNLAPDLMNDTYLTIHEKYKDKPIPCNDCEFVKWFSKCMSNYYKWPNSSFNKLCTPKEYLTVDSSFTGSYKLHVDKDESLNETSSERIIDEDALAYIEIQVEGTNEATKELIEISSSLGKTKTLKYIQLVEFKKSLPVYESILFELYFEKELSTRDIANLYSDSNNTMNHHAVNKMINKIKAKLKSHAWK